MTLSLTTHFLGETSGLVNFVAAVAHHFCPSLPAAFTQPGASTLADLCSDPSLIHVKEGKISILPL